MHRLIAILLLIVIILFLLNKTHEYLTLTPGDLTQCDYDQHGQGIMRSLFMLDLSNGKIIKT